MTTAFHNLIRREAAAILAMAFATPSFDRARQAVEAVAEWPLELNDAEIDDLANQLINEEG